MYSREAALGDLFPDTPFQFSDQNRNRFGVTLFVVDDRRVNGPIHIAQTPRYEIVLESSALSDERKAMPFFDKRLQLRRMRCTRVFP